MLSCMKSQLNQNTSRTMWICITTISEHTSSNAKTLCYWVIWFFKLSNQPFFAMKEDNGNKIKCGTCIRESFQQHTPVEVPIVDLGSWMYWPCGEVQTQTDKRLHTFQDWLSLTYACSDVWYSYYMITLQNNQSLLHFMVFG